MLDTLYVITDLRGELDDSFPAYSDRDKAIADIQEWYSKTERPAEEDDWCEMNNGAYCAGIFVIQPIDTPPEIVEIIRRLRESKSEI